MSALRRALAAAVTAVLLPVRLVVLRVMESNSPLRHVDGLRIVDIAAELPSLARLERIESALACVRKLAPRRYRRVTTDLRRIVITRARAAGEYVPAAGACFLDAEYVETRSREVIASAIVHEATHARLWGRGIRYGSAIRGRVERRCILEEIDFLQHAEGTSDLISVLEQRLTTRPVTDDSVFQRRVEQLRRLGVPGPLLRAYDFVFRPNEPG